MSNSLPCPVIFYGTPEFSVPTLQALIEQPEYLVKAVITQPDRPAGRGKKLVASPIKLLAQKHNIPILQPESIKKTEGDFLTQLKKLGEIKVAIVIAFGQIIPIEVLEYPELGSLNLHASLLPRWRGAAPIQRSILAGDKETGVCLMKMEAGLDTGPYYHSEKIKISDKLTAGELHDSLSSLSAKIIADNLLRFIAGELEETKQDDALATYAKKITKNTELINWSKTAMEIKRQVMALSPYPAAYTHTNEQRLKIYDCEVINAFKTDSVPGEIEFIDKENLVIKTTEDSVSLKEVKVAGKRRMSIKDFLQGQELEVGDILK